MVNLLKFRTHAQYEASRPEAREGISGAEAYQRYGAVAQKCVAEVGGSIVWAGPQALVFIGGAEQEGDQVVCVRYPPRPPFLTKISQPPPLSPPPPPPPPLSRPAPLSSSPPPPAS